MSNSIRISEKHGVNPTMGICIHCKGETGELGLLGRLPNDEEAPRKAILSPIPCDTCRQGELKGMVLLLGFADREAKDLKATMTLPNKVFADIFKAEVPEDGYAYVDIDNLLKLSEAIKKAQTE